MIKVIIHHSKNVTHLAFKVVKYSGKKALHIFFPPVIHYMTDKYQDRWHRLFIDTVFSLVIFALVIGNIGLGYWYYIYTTPAQIEVNLIQSEEIISGDEIEFTAIYQNQGRAVENFQIALLHSPVFTPEGTTEVFLGDLEKNKTGEIIFKGKLLAELNSEQTVKLVYGYSSQGNFFQEELAQNFTVSQSSLEITTELPEKILQDQEFEIKVKYKNNSELTQSDVEIKLDLPEDLEITSSLDDLKISEIKGGQEGEIIIKAKFTEFGDVSNVINITASAENYSQQTSESLIEVLSPRLECSSLVNGSANTVVDLGAILTYSITCENIGDAILKNISITSGERNLTIDQLDPKEEETVYYSRVTNSEIRQYNYSLSTETSAQAQIEDYDLYTYSSATTNEVKFNTALSFSSRSAYYDSTGVQLGYGPWPPEAGEITALRIFWQVEDITNNLSNVTIKTTLPSQVEWTGDSSVTAGTNISYNPGTREVLWHVGSMQAFSRYPLAAGFEVRILPNWQQIGSKINLTNLTSFTAIDAFTQSYLERSSLPLQTEYSVE